MNHRGSLWKLYGFGGKGTITALSGMIGKSKGKNRVKKEAANMEFGCSSFSWETKGGLHLLGRTYDQFGDLKTNQVIQIPQSLSCAPGLRPGNGDLPGRYGYTGMAVLGFGEPVLVDGVNRAGLMGALLHYPEYAVYPQSVETGQTAVLPWRLLAYRLSQCAGVWESIQAFSRIALVDEPIQGKPLQAHYILSDRTGEAVIIEPDREGLHIHRDTIGVLTNSPNYGWHQDNLRNYAGVTNLPKAPQQIAGHEIRAFSERLGAVSVCRGIIPLLPGLSGWRL